ncbi:MAG: class I SAM-dependent methyltransferase [Treponema sp.]|nr:class I SAM-dependent methyltransferase [Treponema sp.]
MSFTDNFGNPQGILGRLMLLTMEREHLPMARWAFSQLDFPQSGKIADIGCGGGYNVKRILERSDQAQVYGIDISQESVKKALKINKKETGKRCQILQESSEKLSFSDGEVDMVTAFETVFFWSNIESSFKEIHRTLKKGGTFVVINNYGNPEIDWEKKVPCMKRYTAEEIKNLMEEASFSDVKISEKNTMFIVSGKA